MEDRQVHVTRELDPKADVSSRRAKDNLERRLALVTDSISRTAVRSLVRVSPSLGKIAVARGADLARAFVAGFAVDGRVHGKPDVLVVLAAVHFGQVVRCAVQVAVLGVAELEQGLGLPLACEAPFGVAGEAHAGLFVGCGDGLGSVGGDGDGVHVREHVEGRGDLVEAEVLGGVALVADFDVDGVGVAAAGAAGGEVGGWECCCRQGEQRAEEPACGVHVDVVGFVVKMGAVVCGMIVRLKARVAVCATV